MEPQLVIPVVFNVRIVVYLKIIALHAMEIGELEWVRNKFLIALAKMENLMMV